VVDTSIGSAAFHPRRQASVRSWGMRLEMGPRGERLESGTLGLNAGVDALAILKRSGQGVTLHIQGRGSSPRRQGLALA
jgi:hypothetical protein